MRKSAIPERIESAVGKTPYGRSVRQPLISGNLSKTIMENPVLVLVRDLRKS